MEEIEKILNNIFIKNGKSNIVFYLTSLFCAFGLIFYLITFLFRRILKK